ncbi:alpha amylase, catalytic domain protein [Bifidobacterium actinocoloniiforme DSM 22766]|uniref:Alpha amylase, catalytic domain protein n=1 Tax=Bifidobacterium actinocoloniiforme DSM 22766 TaxID=1437605 RepID=A0A086YYB6_9BIFI|nr:glycoside hydrolase family 13 protein [Bifidobacterium actinocoloniiforme]AKV55831.1 alpha-amylase [Bifidobacterium actinocoloniiforme DSM 22766]KFI39266.1 alpha amylase, catalytic domain protein [Bifidobacterium actinocoloniiforme DSM 22766]
MVADRIDGDWWKQAVVYQVYPRSFKDADGDGLGDLRGIISEIGYLKQLGVDAVWLSPFYPSELADGGYDVIDYRDVDPRLGSMNDFDQLVDGLHKAGIRLIVDLVPNHTSDHHAWFKEALKAGRGSDARSRYIFREGRGKHGELPPNDWASMFGGSAWERVPDGQWYLHLFAKQQPDLDWKNPEVHEDFRRTLRFWSDHGADGFRIDVAHGLAKDLDSVPLDQMDPAAVQQGSLSDGSSPLWDRDEVHQIYKEWRQVFNEYDPPRFAVGEAWVAPERQYRYASPDELGQVFNFEFAKADWDLSQMRRAIEEGMANARRSGSTTTWVMSNHDVPRHASRYALPQVGSTNYHQLAKDWLLRDGRSYPEDRALGTRRSRAAILLELGLPGSAYIYQGEELGLFEVADLPWERLEDPTAFNTSQAASDKGRDGCRVPLPWDCGDRPDPDASAPAFGRGASFGFSPAAREDGSACADPHLPQPLWFGDFAVNREEADPGSMLNLYRRALAARASMLTGLSQEIALSQPQERTLAYSRADAAGKPAFVNLTNFGPNPVALPDGEVILSSVPLADGLLPSDASAWLSLS